MRRKRLRLGTDPGGQRVDPGLDARSRRKESWTDLARFPGPVIILPVARVFLRPSRFPSGCSGLSCRRYLVTPPGVGSSLFTYLGLRLLPGVLATQWLVLGRLKIRYAIAGRCGCLLMRQSTVEPDRKPTPNC